jgi:hypothetical protein
MRASARACLVKRVTAALILVFGAFYAPFLPKRLPLAVPNERFLDSLRQLGVLYAKTKRFVIRAEQVDPQSRSNIAIFKEQRDALDHVMRALWEHFSEEPKLGEEYLLGQVDKARGHLFRAAYDALDGAGISLKLRIAEAMQNISNEAISAVYPEYYDHVVELNRIDEQIVEHRKNKDIGRTTMQNMDDYSAVVDRISVISGIVTGKVPAFHEWQRRDLKRFRVRQVLLPLGFLITAAALAILLNFLKDMYWRKQPPVSSPPSQSASPQPTISPSN